MNVEEVAVAEIHALRRQVLRRGTPHDVVEFPLDDDPSTSHLAIRDDNGAVIATSTWTDREHPERPGVPAVQLRGMAVHDSFQRRGLGAELITAGVDHARSRGAAIVWANARDSALDFYVANGFVVEGEGFVTDTAIPHHRVVRAI